jgi:hypothetical protein
LPAEGGCPPSKFEEEQMGQEEKRHEIESGKRQETLQAEVNNFGSDESEWKRINAKLDAQLKVEDFRIRWREANHAWSKVWAPTFISVVVALAGIVAGYQSWTAHGLETRKVDAEIIFRAVRAKPDETKANLEALRDAGLLQLTPQQINSISSLTPTPAK